MSNAELLLAVQLEQAGIFFEREVRFAEPRRWRADFECWTADESIVKPPILIEIDGGGFVAGRHTRGAGFEADAEKASAAANPATIFALLDRLAQLEATVDLFLDEAEGQSEAGE
jgi:hypothetical protein